MSPHFVNVRGLRGPFAYNHGSVCRHSDLRGRTGKGERGCEIIAANRIAYLSQVLARVVQQRLLESSLHARMVGKP